MIMKPTHQHDCAKCQFIGATFSNSKYTDWYACSGKDRTTILGRLSDSGPDYWSMDASVLQRAVGQPSHVVSDNKFAFSEQALIAFAMFNIWRELP